MTAYPDTGTLGTMHLHRGIPPQHMPYFLFKRLIPGIGDLLRTWNGIDVIG